MADEIKTDSSEAVAPVAPVAPVAKDAKDFQKSALQIAQSDYSAVTPEALLARILALESALAGK
jgi:hypothetical protein